MALLMYVNTESPPSPPVYDFIGTGADGDATAASNINLSTGSLVGRGNGDAVCYTVTSVGASSCTCDTAPNGITDGDEVILYCAQGNQSNSTNVGNWETFTVDNISSNTINFTTSKTEYYGNGTGSDSGIGKSHQLMKVFVTRVPNYNSLTINPGVTVQGNRWDWGTFNTHWRYGLICIKSKTNITIQGTLQMDDKGYLGRTTGNDPGIPGGTYHGLAPSNSSNRYYGGGGGGDRPFYHGAGGGYGTAGQPTGFVQGGNTYGSADMDTAGKVYFGSAGGGVDGGSFSRRGGAGGGAILLFADTITVEGIISCDGGIGGFHSSFAGGGGAGGSVYIKCGTFGSDSGGGTIEALGNTSYVDGGKGRIAIYYYNLADQIVGDPTPFSQQLT